MLLLQARTGEQEVEKGGSVGLYHEEKHFLVGNGKDCSAPNGIGRIGPDICADEVGIPGYRRGDGNGDEEEQAVDVQAREQGKGDTGEDQGGGKGVGDMSVMSEAWRSVVVRMMSTFFTSFPLTPAHSPTPFFLLVSFSLTSARECV